LWVAENDLDNRIPAGHAAFFNSSPYTRFGYSSLAVILKVIQLGFKVASTRLRMSAVTRLELQIHWG
jgi:hypothetical protein